MPVLLLSSVARWTNPTCRSTSRLFTQHLVEMFGKGHTEEPPIVFSPSQGIHGLFEAFLVVGLA